ncbi:hypothetical protein CPB83DRAFT_845002 [Crepidotus variabilis]|uniref:F-box domain-containing protein n=1 Tax=Crepidotus variabilis TaxID=179855 RepID=A0A9P6EQ88_9AGAR|nr:hypothetical protein CPB83DRAFT_845002 [Crepidotus variabilis]
MLNPDLLPPELLKFSQYLDTNYAPSNEEIHIISKLLDGPSSRLEALTLEIEKLQNELNQKLEEHAALDSQIAEYRALIKSPIRQVPEDILREIFVRCLPQDHSAPMHSTYTPILLLRICSKWREIAISTPQLWASIHIPIPHATPYYYSQDEAEMDDYHTKATETTKKRATAVDSWLARSGACPLDISLFSYGMIDSTYCEEIFTVVRKYSMHWKKLDFVCPADCFKTFASLSPSDVPLLESLTIKGDNEGSGTQSFLWSNCGVFEASKLCEVSISQLDEDATSLPFKWAQLTSLTLLKFGRTRNPPTNRHLFDILRQCVNLVTCRIELPYTPPIVVFIPEDNFSDDPISLPLLQNLALNDGGSDITVYLGRLLVPALESFEFFGGSGWSDTLSTKLGPFLSRVSSTLRTFTTDSKIFVGNAFLDCLRACTHLTSLSMKHLSSYAIPNQATSLVKMNDDFLSCFTSPDENGEYLCPLLETFECRASPAFTDPGLYRFISRKQSGFVPDISKLKRVVIPFNRKQVVLLTEELKTYIEDGFCFDVTYTNSHYFQTQFSTLDGLPHLQPRLYDSEYYN